MTGQLAFRPTAAQLRYGLSVGAGPKHASNGPLTQPPSLFSRLFLVEGVIHRRYVPNKTMTQVPLGTEAYRQNPILGWHDEVRSRPAMPYKAVTDAQKLPLPLTSWHRGTSFKMLSCMRSHAAGPCSSGILSNRLVDAPGREASGARHGWTQCKEIPGHCEMERSTRILERVAVKWLMVQLRGMAVWDTMGGHPLAWLGFREIDELP